MRFLLRILDWVRGLFLPARDRELLQNVEIRPLDIDRDYAEIDRLFEAEEWPFVRGDLEVSHRQPRSSGLVARSGDSVLGFFVAHHFGNIGYLDMMIVDPRARRSAVGRDLYFGTMKAMRRNGMKAFVAHSTNDSYRVFKLLRFQPGQSFTLLRREPQPSEGGGAMPEPERLGPEDRADVLALDARVFGLERPDWIGALFDQPDAAFYGCRVEGRVRASLCLRSRKEAAVCLDGVNAAEFAELEPVLDQVLRAHAGRRIECFARTDSELHRYLERNGFFVPDFFKEIGPLVEWRKGDTGDVGTSPLTQCLSWF